MENKTSDVPLQLISPVWSLFHAAPRQQAELLWLLLYNPIFTFRNGIIFLQGQKNSDPFALVQRHRRQHHRCAMIGSCGSAGSTQWRWGRRRVHEPAQAGLQRGRRRASRARAEQQLRVFVVFPWANYQQVSWCHMVETVAPLAWDIFNPSHMKYIKNIEAYIYKILPSSSVTRC